jgi:C-terminal peptidase prc
MRHRPGPTLAALVFACLSPLTWAQAELEEQVQNKLARANEAPSAQAFSIGAEIADLGDGEGLARIIAALATKGGPRAKLAGAVAIREIADGDGFGKEILDLLTPVVSSSSDDEQILALSVLGSKDAFNNQITPKVRELVHARLSDTMASAAVQAEAARALWQVGSEDQRLLAKQTLLGFLKSSDGSIAVRAALTLAEFNSDLSGPLGSVLRRAATEPTPEGRLAAAYMAREEERRVFQRRLQQLLVEPTGSRGADSRYGLLDELSRMAESLHIRGDSIPAEELLESAAKGMMQALDPHSAFFTPQESQRFLFDLNREYGGIGAFVNFDRDNVFSITRPIYSGPAYRAGLRSGDKILEVDGWETFGRTTEEIIKNLKGPPDTTVVLKIARPGLPEPKDVAIVRQEIVVPSVNYEVLPGGVGYVEVLTFAQNTGEEVRTALGHLQSQGYTSLVLDLRNNTGGYLLAARDLVEMFVEPAKLVVYTKDRSEESNEYRTRRGRQISTELPLAVLVNEFTASASEITAGALQDHGRAKIIGTRSFGKGSVQQILPLRSRPPEPFEDKNANDVRDDWEPFTDANGNGKYDPGAHAKITIARYFLPSGRSIHKEVDREGRVIAPDWGIIPDTEIELREVSAKDAWKNAEIFEIFGTGKLQDFARAGVKSNPDQFLRLADGDGGDHTRYPGFEELYESLDTNLSRDDVRRWVRYLVRDEVADLRGKAYPGGRAVGDIQEDAQLQEAIRQLLAQRGEDIRKIEAYSKTLKIDFEAEVAAKKDG